MDNLHNILVNFKIFVYHRFIYPIKAFKLRRKSKIKVIFVVNDLPVWKTESLFNYMQEHSRFTPIIGITPTIETDAFDEEMESYCQRKKYPYLLLNKDNTIVQQCCPDIIIYQKPYEYYITPKHRIKYNQACLFVYMAYAYNSSTFDWAVNQHVHKYAWQFYLESECIRKELSSIMVNKGINAVVTGTPFMDRLIIPSTEYKDPWQSHDSKKRIIWAPHHTIGDNHLSGIAYSTFLTYADYMLQLAEKYANSVQFAFKPHPVLKGKLYEAWGTEKTDEYYKKWETMSNTQLELGQYLALFKYSDAMIHDCSSFTIEYLCSQKPVLYLTNESNHYDHLTAPAIEAFDLHYKADKENDIEDFIENVIKNNDVMKEKRIEFFNREIKPPYNKTSCENIINSILGENEYAGRK